MDGPCCTHMRVNFDPERTPDGYCRDRWTCQDCGTAFAPAHWQEIHASALATERAARESAEQLAVWAVRKGVMVGHDENVRPCVWFDVHRGVEYDGSDAGILAALRRAMEGEK